MKTRLRFPPTVGANIREKKKIREAIELYEYDRNGFNKVTGASVSAGRVRRDDVRADIVRTDVTFHFMDEDGSSRETYNDVSYSLKDLRKGGWLK